MPVVIAIDAGTTGVRAIAFDRSGRVVGSSYREFPQYFPQPGWVEHDAVEIWEAVQTTLGELCTTLAEPVAAIGITDQRETTVVWDRASGQPVHRAIVWQDRRTAARCDELREAGHLDLVRRTTGLVLDPYFSASKLEWLFTEGGVAVRDGLAFGTIDSWLLWNLTGGRAEAGAVHATDVSNASRTLLFDIRSQRWSPELCALFGVPETLLPEVLPSSGRFGLTAEGVAGVGGGVPVSGIAGDQQAALFGQACFEPGMTKNTYGTGSFVLMNVGEKCPEPMEGLLTTIAWTIPAASLTSTPDSGSVAGPNAGSVASSNAIAVRGGGGPAVTHYALEGAIFVTGAAVQWLRDGLGIIERADEMEALASSVPDTQGVMVVPAFTGLGSPWWDPYARGTVLGISRGLGRAHLARAVIEAMAFQTRDVVEAMTVASGRHVHALRADGGASAMRLLLQLQADQLQVPVTRPKVLETTALGAAYLAGLAEGVWQSCADITENWVLDIEVSPAAEAETVDVSYQRWLRAVERSQHWAQH